MTTQQWSPPGTVSQQYPPCWGNTVSFDPNSRECRSCGAQGTCKEKVDQQRGFSQYTPPPVRPYTPPTTWQPPWQPPVAQTPQTWSTSPWASQQQRAPLAQWQPPQQQMQQAQPQVVYVMQQSPGQEYYGRYNDPMHYAIASAPLPPRNQMQGETFFGRFLKNVFLGALESVAEEALKGARQMVLPPALPNKIIDIK